MKKNVLGTTILTIALALLGAKTAEAQQHPQAPHPAAPRIQVQAARPAVHAPGQAQAQAGQHGQAMRTPAQTKAALLDAAKRTNIPHFVTPNGKVIYNPHQYDHIGAIEPLSQPDGGILQIMLIDGVQHTLGHFEGKYIHFQYINGTNNWRLRPWADRLRLSDKRMYGAMIQLSPEEAHNMRTRIAGIFAEEGPEHLAGPKWENGHIKNSVGVNYFNCASAWCEMPIGKNGESVAKLIGIPSSGDPFSLQRALETGGNEKIVGIGLFGPKQADLGLDPNKRFTR